MSEFRPFRCHVVVDSTISFRERHSRREEISTARDGDDDTSKFAKVSRRFFFFTYGQTLVGILRTIMYAQSPLCAHRGRSRFHHVVDWFSLEQKKKFDSLNAVCTVQYFSATLLVMIPTKIIIPPVRVNDAFFLPHKIP